MKKLVVLSRIFLIAIVASFICGCDKGEDAITYDLTGDWKVVSFENYETSTTITKIEDNTWSQFNNGDITISFVKTNMSSGEFTGINVANSFSGDYTIDQKGGIDIGNFLTTLINEPEWAKLFHAITDADSYEIKNTYLIIYYNQKKNSITLERN